MGAEKLWKIGKPYAEISPRKFCILTYDILGIIRTYQAKLPKYQMWIYVSFKFAKHSPTNKQEEKNSLNCKTPTK